MKYLLLLSTFILIPTIFAQKKTLWVEAADVLQGTIEFSSFPELFVGQEYSFIMISNKKDFDLEIMSENLKVSLVPETKKRNKFYLRQKI